MYYSNPSDVSILVPGAGLGRLAFELARRGYSGQGNEWSLFMLFSSNFVLNRCKEMNRFKLHPWVHQWTNNTPNEDQLEIITFPDNDITEIPEGADFSMAACCEDDWIIFLVSLKFSYVLEHDYIIK